MNNNSKLNLIKSADDMNHQLTLILQLQKLAREEIKNGSIEMGKAMLLKAEQIIREMALTGRNQVQHVQ